MKYNLFNTYLDLSEPSDISPLHTYWPYFSFLDFKHDTDYAKIQAILMPSFRSEIDYLFWNNYRVKSLDDIQLLSFEYPEFKIIVKSIKNYSNLTQKKRALLLRFINKMCWYDLWWNLWLFECENYTGDNIVEIQYYYECLYQIELFKYVYYLEGANDDYNLSWFQYIAENSPVTITKVNAIYQLIIQHVKNFYNLDQVIHWSSAYESVLKEIKWSISKFEFKQLETRFYRVSSFIPQMKNNREEVVRVMDKCLDCVRELWDIASNDREKICYKEMLYPVLESRIQECIWLKDYIAAEKYSKELIALCPTDSRAYFHYWEVLNFLNRSDEWVKQYLMANLLSPPGKEISEYMISKHFSDSKNLLLRDYFLLKTLISDSESISAFSDIQTYSDKEETFKVLFDFFKDKNKNSKAWNNLEDYQLLNYNLK